MIEKETGVLGEVVRHSIQHLETFPAPPNVTKVILYTDEGTSVCPKTSQPDFWSVEIEYEPKGRCIESKSLKLYCWKFRSEASFCENLSNTIAEEIMTTVKPKKLRVTVHQKPRGGIGIKSIVEWPKE